MSSHITPQLAVALASVRFKAHYGLKSDHRAEAEKCHGLSLRIFVARWPPYRPLGAFFAVPLGCTAQSSPHRSWYLSVMRSPSARSCLTQAGAARCCRSDSSCLSKNA
jgi:hypothetical protein